jgi:hypothetical protein
MTTQPTTTEKPATTPKPRPPAKTRAPRGPKRTEVPQEPRPGEVFIVPQEGREGAFYVKIGRTKPKQVWMRDTELDALVARWTAVKRERKAAAK